MSQAASQAAAFYRDVALSQVVWTIEDDGGIPCPVSTSGSRSMPLWSSLARVQRMIKVVPAYSAFRPLSIPWPKFVTAYVPDLSRDGVLCGVNWSGQRAVGYELSPQDLLRNVGFAERSLSAPGRG